MTPRFACSLAVSIWHAPGGPTRRLECHVVQYVMFSLRHILNNQWRASEASTQWDFLNTRDKEPTNLHLSTKHIVKRMPHRLCCCFCTAKTQGPRLSRIDLNEPPSAQQRLRQMLVKTSWANLRPSCLGSANLPAAMKHT